ncbi:MAG: NADPH-dependent glutamate synthase [Clostridia bacterium]|nr:NADPH-dependent glutamate synthase [Clostridia bacterium]
MSSRNEMPVQDPDVRNKNFSEVALGYTEEQAHSEACRCLNCKNSPCVTGCPVGVHIPDFIQLVKSGDYEGAYKVIVGTNSFPAVCGRVCPQEKQCESKCVRGIKGESVAIGRLERFVADTHNAKDNIEVSKAEPNGYKVAIAGSGPAGLSCAGALAGMGYDVTVFEALHVPGGVLSYGIPEFRLPKAVVKKEIDSLIARGVKIELNTVIGKTLMISELLDEYDAVFIGSGAGLPRFMGIPGENLNGVFSANEYLTRINLMKAYKEDSQTPLYHAKKIAVIGGGNVAMDAARCAKRTGADVTIVYRRSEKELPARLEEVHHAKEEGIEFSMLTDPYSVSGDEKGNVTGLNCRKMKLGEPDKSGRARPEPVEGSDFVVEADAVIIAIGTTPNPLIKNTTNGLETQPFGGIIADENGLTSINGVYAGGDAVTGAATVILAMGAGRTAAKAIDEYIKSKNA